MLSRQLTKEVISAIAYFCKDKEIEFPDHHGVSSHTNFKELVGEGKLPELATFLSNRFQISLTPADLDNIQTIRGLKNLIFEKKRKK